MEGTQTFKVLDEFLGHALVLVSRAIFNRLT